MSGKRAVIDPNKCDKSANCPVKRICPANAVEREEIDDPYYINSFCQGCGKCVDYCPRKAVAMV